MNDKTMSLALALIFMALAVLEARNSVLNTFVLLTIAATYFKGAKKGYAYMMAASLIAVCFAAVSGLSMLASVINATFFEGQKSFEVGIVGFVSLIPLLKLRRGHTL